MMESVDLDSCCPAFLDGTGNRVQCGEREITHTQLNDYQKK